MATKKKVAEVAVEETVVTEVPAEEIGAEAAAAEVADTHDAAQVYDERYAIGENIVVDGRRYKVVLAELDEFGNFKGIGL